MRLRDPDLLPLERGKNIDRGMVVGLDVGRYRSQLCLLDQDAEMPMEVGVETSVDAITEILSAHRPRIDYVVMEATANSFDLCRRLRARGYPAILIDARHAAPFLRTYNQAKTDKNDAFGLALLVTQGVERRVWVRSSAASEILAKLATRDALINSEVSLRNALQSHLAALGLTIKCRARKKYLRLFEAGISRLDGYAFLRILHDTLRQLDAVIVELDKELKTQAKRDATCSLLMTIPGVGPFTALRFVSLVDDPTRFACSRDLGSYVGLVPRVRQSGETKRHGGLTRRGSIELRRSLYLCAQVLLSHTKKSGRLRTWGAQIAQRRGKKRATAALARKLAVVMHAVWASGQPYKG